MAFKPEWFFSVDRGGLLDADVGEKFLHEIRRVPTTADFFRVCKSFLDHTELMSLKPEQTEVLTAADNG